MVAATHPLLAQSCAKISWPADLTIEFSVFDENESFFLLL
jgi:hypothetical protein